jgi:hypothetical protein
VNKMKKRIYTNYSKYCHYILTDRFPDSEGKLTGTIYKTGRFGVANFSEDTILKRAKVRLTNYITQANPNGPKYNQRDTYLHGLQLKMVLLGKTTSKLDAKSYENHMIERFRSRDLLNRYINRECPAHAFGVITMEACIELPPRKHRKPKLAA